MNHLPPVLYRGSVKNVRGEVSAPELLFEFSDRYSVFDWGEMPDQLNDKGKTLALMGKSFFKYLGNAESWKGLFQSRIILQTFSKKYLNEMESSLLYQTYCKQGLPHHALIGSDLSDDALLKVKNIAVNRPDFDGEHYDYAKYKSKPVNALVPLEVIFRLGLPPGNSLSKRLGNELAKWQAFGFETIKDNGLLERPFIDFSTKLERGDRYLDYQEAQSIACLSEKEWNELLVMTNLIALNLFHFHHKLGLELWDGKIEVAFMMGANGERSFMLVDSIGIDELRLLYKGKSFSKEFLRETYKNSSWYQNLEAAKKDSLTGQGDFKSICLNKYKSAPEPLTTEIKERAEAVYKSYANAVTKEVWETEFFDSSFTLENYGKRFL